MTIAGMILVNNPGTWAHIYWPLEHAAWNGWTPTDLIFPFFLFIVGVSMVYSFGSRAAKGASRARLALHVVQRSALIFAVGFFLNGFPYFHLTTIRIPGVLQRIAVCYLCAGLIVLATRLDSGRAGRIARAAVIAVLLVSYWAAMTFVPVPGYGAGHLNPESNLGAYIDRSLMGGHLWSQSKTWDPEGVMSTFPAIATVLIGVLVGEWLRSERAPRKKFLGLAAMGVAGLLVGRALHPFFPINKNLWTSTYVIFTGGFAALLLGLCYWAADMRAWRRWGTPFVVYGTNAILAFSVSTLLAKMSIVFHVTDTDGKRITWHGYVWSHWFAPLASPINASLIFALCYVVLFLLLLWPLYRKRIFVRI